MSIEAGVLRGSVLSPTQFLMHINEMFSSGCIHCSVDDSMIYGCYCNVIAGACSQVETERLRTDLVSHLNQFIVKVTLVDFNDKKTHVCVFSCKKSLFSHCPTPQNVTIVNIDSLIMLETNRLHTYNMINIIQS